MNRDRTNAELRWLLCQFPDRETYEQWLTEQQIVPAMAARLETLLPERLQQQGTV